MREKGERGRKGARTCLESAKDGAQAGLGREKAAERAPLNHWASGGQKADSIHEIRPRLLNYWSLRNFECDIRCLWYLFTHYIPT